MEVSQALVSVAETIEWDDDPVHERELAGAA
jgi:hypothetical protein